MSPVSSSTKAELDALNAANTQRDMRARVAASTGVPVELLTGDTEEACTAQAQAALKFAKKNEYSYPVLRDGGAIPYERMPGFKDTSVADSFSRDKKHEPRSHPCSIY